MKNVRDIALYKPCVLCLNQTYDRCLECGDAYCSTHETRLCPMCTRIREFKAEQAERRRIVYWQYADVPVSNVRSVGAETLPMPTLRMEAA